MATSALALVAAINLGQGSLRADQELSVKCDMPVHVTANINETGCDNSPGPQITLDGTIVLGGLQVELIFENNVKGTHQTVVTLDKTVELIPVGQEIVIPKQPVLGGVGGNPLFLGRCVQL